MCKQESWEKKTDICGLANESTVGQAVCLFVKKNAVIQTVFIWERTQHRAYLCVWDRKINKLAHVEGMVSARGGKTQQIFACREINGEDNDVCDLASERTVRSAACAFLKRNTAVRTVLIVVYTRLTTRRKGYSKSGWDQTINKPAHVDMVMNTKKVSRCRGRGGAPQLRPADV